MRVLIQRVNSASVSVGKTVISSIDKGLLVFLGIARNDTEKDCNYIIRKILNLRIFPDQKGYMDKSIVDISGQILLVSQFTLYANCSKGNRPSFEYAMRPDQAKVVYEDFTESLRHSYSDVAVMLQKEFLVPICLFR